MSGLATVKQVSMYTAYRIEIIMPKGLGYHIMCYKQIAVLTKIMYRYHKSVILYTGSLAFHISFTVLELPQFMCF